MATLEFKQLYFEEGEEALKVNFNRLYYFYLQKIDLEKIGKYSVNKNKIIFNASEQRAKRKFNLLLNEGFKRLINKVSKRQNFYIHKNSGIPLLGCLYFGIVDKGSSMLEVKPLTSCNMNCIFCSIDEGNDSRRLNDYLVEEEYLVEETKKILDFKKEKMDIYINPHGEPLLYPEIVELCQDLSKLKYISSIKIITSATPLTKGIIDSFAKNKKTKLNVSLHAIDESIAKKLFGTKAYNIAHVLKMLKYASSKMDIIIAPVLLQGFNEAEMPKIIEFARQINAKVLVQKYLLNKMGRNPAKEESWESFFKKLKQYEKDTGFRLIEELAPTKKTKELPLPFKTGDVIDVKIMLPGRFKGEKLAVAKGRIISVPNCFKEINKEARIRITRTKYGLFKGS